MRVSRLVLRALAGVHEPFLRKGAWSVETCSSLSVQRGHASMLQPFSAGDAGGSSFGRAFASSMAFEKMIAKPEAVDFSMRLAPWPHGPYVPITQAARLPYITLSAAKHTRREIWRAQNQADDFEMLI